MSPILLLSILLQITCAVHVVRSGRPMYWIFILLIGSYIVVANGVFREVLTRADVSPKYYRREQREWIEIAKRELG